MADKNRQKNKYYVGFSEEFAFDALNLIRHIVMEENFISVHTFKNVLMIKPTQEFIQPDCDTGWITITDFEVGRTNQGEYYIHTTDPVVLTDYWDTILERRRLRLA